MSIVEVEHLHKAYGPLVAVDDVSFEVYEGEIFGMVGPNAAGKTTTIECIEGLRRPGGGSIRVLGLNPHKDGYALREHIGMQLQESALPDRIRVWEALNLFASFFPRSVDWQRLIEQFGLADRRKTPFAKLSGGQKQRLSIALALLNDPKLVFLDELTTGLDPQARRAVWDLVRDIRDQGKTVFLTTHYMEEAERLCDRVAIIDSGSIIALDTPAELIRSFGMGSRLVFSADRTLSLDSLRKIDGVSHVEQIGEQVIVHGQDDKLVVNVVNVLASNGFVFRDLRTEQATLEDVFLKLTGREMRD